jgi:hypothetical protein
MKISIPYRYIHCTTTIKNFNSTENKAMEKINGYVVITVVNKNQLGKRMVWWFIVSFV